jgi:hypothetical protein
VAPSEPPNVRAVGTAKEREALNARYEKAIQGAETRGCEAVVKMFQSDLKNSCAVIGSDLHIIRQLLTSDKTLYNNYASLVHAQFRKPALDADDRNRRVAEAILLDGYFDQIVYAALSLDGVGLKSYGLYSITLRDVAVAQRATVLEENSFSFVKKRCAVGDAVPKGYRAVWSERDKLGVAKLAGKLTPTSKPSDFPTLVLTNGRDRDSDDFLEVHIYGPFDGQAIDYVRGPARPKRSDERAIVKVLKEKMAAAGKKWVDA